MAARRGRHSRRRRAPRAVSSAGEIHNRHETKLLQAAEAGWKLALSDYYYPGIPEPEFVFDTSRQEGFYISPENGWRITLNLLEAPYLPTKVQYRRFFRSISQHEIGHYDMCPYDGLLTAKLLSAAMEKVNRFLAPIVLNVFADLLIDTHLFRRNEMLTLWRERKIVGDILADFTKKGALDQLTRFWKVLVKSYEYLWERDLGVGELASPAECSIASRVAKIVKKDMFNQATWPLKVKKIASLLSNTLKEDFSVQAGLGQGARDRNCPAGDAHVEVPEEVLRTVGDPNEIKNREQLDRGEGEEEDTIRDRNRDRAEEFARDKSLNNFGAPASLAGLIEPEEALATWYRGRASGLIDIKIYEVRPGGFIPAYPLPWRVGDPVGELDFVQSLHVSPVVIPNLTTRKWHKTEGPASRHEVQPPDMLLVVDSSGSMQWNPYGKRKLGEYDTALVASFAALHFASRKGCKVAGLNFSDRGIATEWTKNYALVERILLSYQGGGTEIPVDGMLDLVRATERSALVLLITDFGIYNFRSAFRAFADILQMRHKLVGFFIGGTAKDLAQGEMQRLQELGARFYPVQRVQDLVGLVIEEVREYYADA